MSGEAATNLGRRVVSATFWTMLLKVVTRLLGLVTTVVLARLLTPSDYGVFAVVAIGDAMLSVLSETSLSTALVQFKDPEELLDTAFSAQVARGIVITCISYVIAPYWCTLFGVPEAAAPLRVLSLAQLIQGFTSIRTVLLQRDMRFDKLFPQQVAQALANAGTVLVAAAILRSYWAFVLAPIAENVARVVFSYIVAPYRPRLAFDREKARRMFGYTRWLMGYQMLDFVLETGGPSVVGKLFGREVLGLYRMANQLAAEGSRSLSTIVGRVAFSMFANVQDDPTRIRRGFHAVLGSTVFVLFPLTASFVTFGDLAIGSILGQRWVPAVGPMGILAGACCVRGVIETTTTLFRGLGHSRAEFLIKLIQFCTLAASIYPLGRWLGVTGVAYAVLAATLAALPLWLYFIRAAAKLSIGDAIVPAIVPAVATLGASVATLVTRRQVAGWGWAAFPVTATVFVAVYVACAFVVQRATALPGFLPELQGIIARRRRSA